MRIKIAKEIIIIDICGTLYHSNTTFDFLRYIKPIRSKILFSFPSKVFFKLFMLVTNQDLLRSMCIKCLSGIPKSYLYARAALFHNEVLKHKIVLQTQELIYNFKKEQECDLYFYSASIDPVVHVISEFYSIPYKSSELQYSDGVSTGSLSLDLLGKKDAYLNNQQVKYVITDNKSDLKLIYKSEKSFIITSQNNLAFWNTVKRDQDELIIL